MSTRALLVGINNFIRPQWQLKGCISDTTQMQDVLQTYFGFPPEDIRVLKDRDACSRGIREGLGWLLSDYDNDGSDVRVFHFSSHGTQVEDQGDDEWERLDEVIVPYDHDWERPFRDDDLKAIFDGVPQGVNLTFIADCCHSGDIQRALPEIEFYPRMLLPPVDVANRIKDLQAERDAAQDAYVATNLAQMLQGVPSDQWAEKMQEYMALLKKQFRKEHFAVVPYEKHFTLSACESKQTAADARIGGEWRGAFSWALGKAIRESGGDLTYDELISRAAAKITDYDQRPQLACPTELRGKKLFAPLG